MATFGKFVLGFILFAISLYLTAVATATLWGWFIVPLGVKAIGAVHAYGLSMFVHFLTVKLNTRKSDNSMMLSINGQLTARIALSLAALLIGWTTVQFM